MSTLEGMAIELALLLIEGALSRSDLDRLYRRGAPKGAPPPQRLERARVVGAIVGRALGKDGKGPGDRALESMVSQAMDKRARTEIRLLDGMTTAQAGELLENYGGLRFAKQRARMMWAVARHEDSEIRALGARISKQLLEGLDEGNETIRLQAQAQNQRQTPGLPSPDSAQLQLQVGRLRRDLETRDQRLFEMREQLEALQGADRRAAGAQRRADAARQELDELHRRQNRQLDELKATLRQREKELEALETERNQLAAKVEQPEDQDLQEAVADPRLDQLRRERDAARRDRAQLQERLHAAQRRLPESGPREGLLVLLDLANLSAGARPYGRPIDYSALVVRLCAGRQPTKVIAFTSGDPHDQKSKRFTEKLQADGIEVRWKPFWRQSDGSVKADWDVGITLEALRWLHDVDSMILGSGDGDFVELVEQLQAEGLRVEAAGWPERSHRELKARVDRFHSLETQDLLP